jgi:hypothetical protein
MYTMFFRLRNIWLCLRAWPHQPVLARDGGVGEAARKHPAGWGVLRVQGKGSGPGAAPGGYVAGTSSTRYCWSACCHLATVHIAAHRLSPPTLRSCLPSHPPSLSCLTRCRNLDQNLATWSYTSANVLLQESVSVTGYTTCWVLHYNTRVSISW